MLKKHPSLQVRVVSILTVVICISASVHSESNCSGTVGSVSLTLRLDGARYTSSPGAFFNFNETATCGGPVMGWRFCYYLREGYNDTDFDIPPWVGAWRPINDTAYQLINESFHPLPISAPSEGIQFVCEQWILPSESRFSIDAGSVVGVYFPEGAKAAHVIAKERKAAVTYFREGGLEDVYFISSESLVELSGFALYVEALMGNETSTLPNATVSATTITVDITTEVAQSSAVPLWAIYTLCVLGVVTLFMAFALSVVMYKYSRSYKREIRLGTESGQISKTETEMQESPQHSNHHSRSRPSTPQTELETIVDSRNYSSTVSIGEATTPQVHNNYVAMNTHQHEVSFKARSQTALNPVSKKNHHFKERRSERIVANKTKHFDEIIIATEPNQDKDQARGDLFLRPPTKRLLPQRVSPSSNRRRNSLRRSKSEMNLLMPHREKLIAHSTQNNEEELVSSVESDYPYVFHSREVLGHCALKSTHSLPNLLSHMHFDLSSSQCKYSGDGLPLSKYPQPYLEYEPVYSYPYDFTAPPALQFLVDSRDRKISKVGSSYYGMQLKELREKRTSKKPSHSSKEKVTDSSENIFIPQIMSPEYVEIPVDWVSPREKPMPLPRKGKCGNQSSESSRTDLSSIAIETSVNWEVRTSKNGRQEDENEYMDMSSPDYLPLIPLSKEAVDDIYTIPSHMTEEDEGGVNEYDLPPV